MTRVSLPQRREGYRCGIRTASYHGDPSQQAWILGFRRWGRVIATKLHPQKHANRQLPSKKVQGKKDVEISDISRLIISPLLCSNSCSTTFDQFSPPSPSIPFPVQVRPFRFHQLASDSVCHSVSFVSLAMPKSTTRRFTSCPEKRP